MTKPYPQIHLGAPGEEISIKDLRTVKLRFKKLHQIRMHCIYDFLQPRQQIFLDLLALMFHVNSPLLPGYVSSSAPAGVFGYSPSNRALNAAKKLAKNFTYKAPRSDARRAIEGLYLMGSVGSIAFLKSSDMDIWLCHDTELLPDEIRELERKVRAVESWAVGLGLEVHFFLMNCKHFRNGLTVPISSESSGDTQHYLLLEEFYRTSIYIAGKYLAWWLVPPHQEHNYDAYLNHLIAQRFIDEDNLIDFGGLNAVPVEEFFSATLWHIYKSLRSPYKSLLKLMLMECYASEYPDPRWLCHQIKQAIYQGNFTSVDLDPYVLIYLKVEAYLRSIKSLDRIELARQNFFLKVLDSSDDALSAQTIAYREKYLKDIADRCHWPANTVEELKLHRFWDIRKAISEHGIIVQQLNHFFHVIMTFARDQLSQSHRQSQDLKLIGRKLYSFLEKKAGKIEIITTRSLIQNKTQELSIAENQDPLESQRWHLYPKNGHPGSNEDAEPILKCRTLIEILGWLVINKLCSSGPPLDCKVKCQNLANEELERILSQLACFFQANIQNSESLANYHFANTLRKSFVVINMGVDFPDEPDSGGLYFISELSDVLNYGLERRCLIQTMDKISISNWNEITSSHYEGIEGFFECLIDIINHHKKPVSPEDLTLICNTPIRANSIIRRVNQLFGTLAALFAGKQADQPARYLLKSGDAFYLFQHHDQTLQFKSLKSREEVFAELSRPQLTFNALHFDGSAFADTPVPLIYSLNRPDTIQFCYFEHNPLISVYILDEKGTLFLRQHSEATPRQLLKQYAVFIESVLQQLRQPGRIGIEYYEIRKNSTGTFSCRPVSVTTPSAGSAFRLRVTGKANGEQQAFIFQLNGQEFSSLVHGSQVLQAVYRHMVQLRESGHDYPVHITEINMPPAAFGVDDPERLQTIHFLELKQKIEERLKSRKD
ncbi:MAG: class I adenylate cyclase [Gammaproteobacteria bacterium]